MTRFALVLFLLIGVPAMAKDGGGLLGQMKPTPQGDIKPEGAPPTDGEIAMQMWRQYMGDAPFPKHLRKKYGIPDDDAPKMVIQPR